MECQYFRNICFTYEIITMERGDISTILIKCEYLNIGTILEILVKMISKYSQHKQYGKPPANSTFMTIKNTVPCKTIVLPFHSLIYKLVMVLQ